jgi:hypothetical protein
VFALNDRTSVTAASSGALLLCLASALYDAHFGSCLILRAMSLYRSLAALGPTAAVALALKRLQAEMLEGVMRSCGLLMISSKARESGIGCSSNVQGASDSTNGYTHMGGTWVMLKCRIASGRYQADSIP